MKDLRGEASLIILALLIFKLNAQGDSVFIQEVDSYVNDSVKKKTITFFNPEVGINIPFEISKIYNYNKLIEENTTYHSKLHGVVKKYYANGQLQEYSNYILGSRIGPYFEYYRNGHLKCIGEYNIFFNDSIVHLLKPLLLNETNKTSDGSNPKIIMIQYNQGCKDGEWCFFDENGTLLRRELWNFGILKK